jgi:OFA family oxalate/formate antiporter-like MFS transporter
LYAGAALGGIGTGCVYGTCVGNALKWFPRRRGLAAGITAMGFGVGSAFTVSPIRNMIESSGYEHTFLVFGLIQGGIVFLMAWLLRVPPAALAHAALKPNQTAHGYSPGEVLRSPCFYVLYLMFVLIAAGGLTMAASMASIATDLGVGNVPVNLF